MTENKLSWRSGQSHVTVDHTLERATGVRISHSAQKQDTCHLELCRFGEALSRVSRDLRGISPRTSFGRNDNELDADIV